MFHCQISQRSYKEGVYFPRMQRQQALDILEKATTEGIRGVYEVRGALPGPTMTVFMATHGNEPVGLYAFLHFHAYFQEHALEAGRLLFILSNPKAAQQYHQATTEEEQRLARFVDINMNRLPLGAHESSSSSYEIQRLQEIYPLLLQTNIAIDLHSTSLPSEPMLIPMGNASEKLLKALPVETVISNVDKVIGNLFLISYVGGFLSTSTESVLLECGLHEDPGSINNAVNAVKALLNAYELHRFEGLQPVPKKIYAMKTSVFFPHDSYSLVRDFGNFEPILQNEILATGDGEHIMAPHEGHALFAFKGGRPPSIAEEAMFLTSPAQILE